MKDLYAVLGVEPSATRDDIKRAFHAYAARNHPDRPGGDEDAFKAAAAAYTVLSDPVLRVKYDATRAAKPGSAAAKEAAQAFFAKWMTAAWADVCDQLPELGGLGAAVQSKDWLSAAHNALGLYRKVRGGA